MQVVQARFILQHVARQPVVLNVGIVFGVAVVGLAGTEVRNEEGFVGAADGIVTHEGFVGQSVDEGDGDYGVDGSQQVEDVRLPLVLQDFSYGVVTRVEGGIVGSVLVVHRQGRDHTENGPDGISEGTTGRYGILPGLRYAGIDIDFEPVGQVSGQVHAAAVTLEVGADDGSFVVLIPATDEVADGIRSPAGRKVGIGEVAVAGDDVKPVGVDVGIHAPVGDDLVGFRFVGRRAGIDQAFPQQFQVFRGIQRT